MSIKYIPEMPFGNIYYNPDTAQAVGFLAGHRPIVFTMKQEFKNELPSAARDINMPPSEFEKLVAASARQASSALEMQRASSDVRRILDQYGVNAAAK